MAYVGISCFSKGSPQSISILTELDRYQYLVGFHKAQSITPEMVLFQPKSFEIFSYFSMKTYVVGTH